MKWDKLCDLLKKEKKFDKIYDFYTKFFVFKELVCQFFHGSVFVDILNCGREEFLMLALGKYIADKMGLGGEEFSKIWNDIFKLLEMQMNFDTYKKLIEYSKDLYEGTSNQSSGFDFIKEAFSVDEAFLSEDLAIQKSMNIGFYFLHIYDQEKYKVPKFKDIQDEFNKTLNKHFA